MSYTALYRKYRPDTFEEVKGQEHVVTTLRNQIIAGRTSHAYLFTGSRGTGKTSVAKIFARAVNCESPVEGSPCNECPTCRAIASGASLNVIEIDAASNNGVENIRQIREEVAYPPTQGRFKVYIIDEVHMLSAGAFNALLKTLEEPPAYVIFILATTEVHKIPVTILSRCQRYDFRRISQEEITLRLQELLEREHVEAQEKALRFIARKAEGGMRDALSLTDQCISFYLGQTLTYDKVLDVLGAVDTQVLGELFRRIVKEDVAGVFALLDELIYKGRELNQLVSDLTEYLRDLLLIRTTPEADQILDVSEENLALLKEEAALTDENELLRDIRIFSELSGQMRYAARKRTVLEVALIKLCRPAMESDLSSLTARIRSIEKLIESGALVSAAAGGGSAAYAPAPAPAPGASPAAAPEKKPVVYHKAAPEVLARIDSEWGQIVGQIEDAVPRGILQRARRKFDAMDPAEDVLYVVYRRSIETDFLKDRNLSGLLEELIEERTGSRIHVKMLSEESEEGEGAGMLTSIRETAQAHIRIPIETVPDQE